MPKGLNLRQLRRALWALLPRAECHHFWVASAVRLAHGGCWPSAARTEEGYGAILREVARVESRATSLLDQRGAWERASLDAFYPPVDGGRLGLLPVGIHPAGEVVTPDGYVVVPGYQVGDCSHGLQPYFPAVRECRAPNGWLQAVAGVLAEDPSVDDGSRHPILTARRVRALWVWVPRIAPGLEGVALSLLRSRGWERVPGRAVRADLPWWEVQFGPPLDPTTFGSARVVELGLASFANGFWKVGVDVRGLHDRYYPIVQPPRWLFDLFRDAPEQVVLRLVAGLIRRAADGAAA